MKHVIHYLLFTSGILWVVASCSNGTEPKIVFMESGKVFEAFEMKKDLDKILEADLKSEAQHMDSLGVILNQSSHLDTLELFKLRKAYYVAEELFNRKYEQLAKEYTNQVHERLNLYIEDYSKEKGYSIVLGSSGGNVMYVADAENITENLIEYVNTKYSNNEN